MTTWRDAAEFIALGAGSVQVCTAAMTYGFRIVEDMIDGLSNYLDEKALSRRRRARRPRRAVDRRLAVPRPEPRRQGGDRPGIMHPVRALPRRLRDTSHQAITAVKNGRRHFEVIEAECVGCNLCVGSARCCITLRARAGEVDAHRQDGDRRVRQLDHAPEQSPSASGLTVWPMSSTSTISVIPRPGPERRRPRPGQPVDRRGRVHLADRSLGLRQDDAAARDRRPRPVTSGSVRVNGHEPARRPRLARGMAACSRRRRCSRGAPVLANVMLPLEIHGPRWPRARDRARAPRKRVGLTGFDAKYPWQLSGGMQQRVSIARARFRAEAADDGRALRRARRDHPRPPERAVLRLWEREQRTVVFVTPRSRKLRSCRRASSSCRRGRGASSRSSSRGCLRTGRSTSANRRNSWRRARLRVALRRAMRGSEPKLPTAPCRSWRCSAPRRRLVPRRGLAQRAGRSSTRLRRPGDWTWRDLVGAAWNVERPVLPAPHQIAADLYGSIFDWPVDSPRSLVYHAAVTAARRCSASRSARCSALVLAVAIVQMPTLERRGLPVDHRVADDPGARHRADRHRHPRPIFDITGVLPKAVISMYLCFFSGGRRDGQGLRSPGVFERELMHTYAASPYPDVLEAAPAGVAAVPLSVAARRDRGRPRGAIVGELPTGAQARPRARLLTGSYYGNTVQIWSALVMAALLGLALTAAVSLAERAPRRRRQTLMAGGASIFGEKPRARSSSGCCRSSRRAAGAVAADRPARRRNRSREPGCCRSRSPRWPPRSSSSGRCAGQPGVMRCCCSPGLGRRTRSALLARHDPSAPARRWTPASGSTRRGWRASRRASLRRVAALDLRGTVGAARPPRSSSAPGRWCSGSC